MQKTVFYDGTQSRAQLHCGDPSNKDTQIQQKSNKEIEHISNKYRQRFKGRKTQDRKMNKQNIQLKNNKNYHAQQNKQYKNKDNIIKDMNQLNDDKHNIGQLSTSVLDLLSFL